MEVEIKSKAEPERFPTKGKRDLKGKMPSSPALIPTVSPAENGQPIEAAVLAPAQMESQTQIANRIFRQRAEKIADAMVTIRPGENEWEPIHRVEVPELRSEAFDKIVKLRSNLYRKYPDATINIEFRGRRELDEANNNPRYANL